MLRVADLDYHLPEALIATAPASPRDSARLLVVSRSDPARLEDRRVSDLPGLLGPGDLMVVNSSRVLPARLAGRRADTAGRVEGLYLGADAAGHWRVMLKGRRMKPGILVDLLGTADAPSGFALRLIGRAAATAPGEPISATGSPALAEQDDAAWLVEPVTSSGAPVADPDPAALLATAGRTPLPPYIRAARKRLGGAEDSPTDSASYQTVYASDAAGSVAAPTAGLHFTPALLNRLAASGVDRADVTLHVGTGTFKPVETEFVEQHPMHAEWCQLPRATAAAIARARRVVAIGTTSARVLESFPDLAPPAGAGPDALLSRWSRILITPGHQWRHVHALMTNFHLPRSTLMAMVAALLDERSGAGHGNGVARLQAIYAHALAHSYRFYSFGDAMLVLP